ncbi:MAG: hypothetical protein AAFZ18_39140, partial [Myxococcota bacterium]
AGAFGVLVSAITRDGWLLLDEIQLTLDEQGPSPPELIIAEPGPGAPPPRPVDAPAAAATKREAAKDLPEDLSDLAFPRRI